VTWSPLASSLSLYINILTSTLTCHPRLPWGGFLLPLNIGTTSDVLAKSLDLDGKVITLRRNRPGTRGFSTVVATDVYPSLEGIPYRHKLRLTDDGRIKELRLSRAREPPARDLESITLRLGSLQVSLLPDKLIDDRNGVTLSKLGQGYEDTGIFGDISAVPISATYIHHGETKSIDKFDGDAWKDLVLSVRRTFSVKDTDLNLWVKEQEAIHALAARGADGTCSETSEEGGVSTPEIWDRSA
jgi:hypothetical protein